MCCSPEGFPLPGFVLVSGCELSSNTWCSISSSWFMRQFKARGRSVRRGNRKPAWVRSAKLAVAASARTEPPPLFPAYSGSWKNPIRLLWTWHVQGLRVPGTLRGGSLLSGVLCMDSLKCSRLCWASSVMCPFWHFWNWFLFCRPLCFREFITHPSPPIHYHVSGVLQGRGCRHLC